MSTLIQRFQSLTPAKRKRVLNAAINVNGRIAIGSARRDDEKRYKAGQIIRSTYPISLMETLLSKIK